MIVVQIITTVMLPAFGNPLLLAIAHAGLVAGSWHLLLRITGKLERWHQSISAIFGTGALLNIVSMPLIVTSINTGAAMDAQRPGIASYTFLLLWIWDIAITSRIVRETIEVRLLHAVGLSFVLSLVIRFVLVSLFGPA